MILDNLLRRDSGIRLIVTLPKLGTGALCLVKSSTLNDHNDFAVHLDVALDFIHSQVEFFIWFESASAGR
jgi:hypothetical protein